MKSIFTFSSAVLMATMAAIPSYAQDTEQSSSFTPVSDISTAGWYQIKLKTSTEPDGTALVTAGKNYVQVTNNEFKVTSGGGKGCYLLKFAAEPTDKAKATTYFYITPTSTTDNYNVQTINGHYIGSQVIASTSASDITIVKGSDTDFSIKAGSTYLEYYKASGCSESPLVGGYGSASNVRYQLSKVDNLEDTYDIYTVNINKNINTSYPSDQIQVTCNSTAQLGLTSVYNGGKFFFAKGTNVTSSFFSVPTAYGLTGDISVDSSNRTINITYTAPTLSTYLQDGDIVKFTNVQYDGTELPIYMDSTGLMVNSTNSNVGNKAYFVTKKLDNDKYVFVSVATGTYLGYAGKTSGSNTTSGLNETYAADYSACTLKAGANIFNTYYLLFNKRASNAGVGTIVILYSSKGFDGWGNSEAYSTTYSNLFYIEKVTDFTYNKVNLQAKDSRNYASVYLPYSYTLPNNVEAYYGKALSEDNNQIVLTKIDGNVVPKSTAVVLTSESVSGTQTLVPALNATAPTAITDNKLSGTLTETTTETGKTYYGFTGKYSQIGFYKWTGTNLPLGKAYIAVDGSATASQAFILSFNNGTISGINTIEDASKEKANAYYDLSGRRVKNPTKGVYVVNGNKVILK